MTIAFIPGNGSTTGSSNEAGPINHHVLSVLVENRAGVLARIAQLFSRRGYNIFSLAVAPTDDAKFSRITIVVDVDSVPLEQITKQLHKLINVIKISELDPADSVECELLVATVNADVTSRGYVMELVALFDGKIIDVGTDRLTVLATGEPGRLDDFSDLLSSFGIVELQRTGRVALAKLERQGSKAKNTSGRIG